VGTERREGKRRLAAMVSVRLSADEEQAVREAAAARGESVSNFIRQLVLAEVKPAVVAPLSAASATSTTSTVGVALEYVDGGKLIARSRSPRAQPV
jgi:ABC-type methionine transport system permease subunit